jgi:photosystem II stability/assembly factor-like uncharacterized protein
MTRLFIALENCLAVGRESDGGWTLEQHLLGQRVECVALDPRQPRRVYLGTDSQGLWRSDDGGDQWSRVGHDSLPPTITALAVGPTGAAGPWGAVYAGAEPSALFISADGGDTWRERPGLNDLPSAATWSFPPRPHTHHVRWIQLDPFVADRFYLCIEAGALVRSLEGTELWEDRVMSGPLDTHTLATSAHAQGRLYAAAGDGYFEIADYGHSWQTREEGLGHRYLFGLVVDPTDPDLIIVSAAASPQAAHNARWAESYLYRSIGGGPWRPLEQGLPPARGTTISSLAVQATQPALFYAANNQGVFRSADGGQSWEQLALPWPASFAEQRVQGLVVADLA